MTRIYLKLLLGIFVISGFMVLIAPTLGNLGTANPALEGIYVGCLHQPQPCWYGIHPGQTSLTDAIAIVHDTPYVSWKQRPQILTIVYRSSTTRCGVEIRSKAQTVDTVTIMNCLDKQVGDVVQAMHNANHKVPFSMGMLDATLYDEAQDTVAHDAPCLNYTSYGQIIGMPLGLPGEPPPTKPDGWHDYLPYG